MNNYSFIVDASVYAPLIATLGKKLLRVAKIMNLTILDLTIYETCNAFWKECIKLKKIDRETALQACDLSVKFTKFIKIFNISQLNLSVALNIALRHNITLYDASYIALAKELNQPIASNDKDIILIAPKYGVKVVDLNNFIELINNIIS